MVSDNHFKYVLGLGDDSLIVAQRLSEWAYKAPFLEEDIGEQFEVGNLKLTINNIQTYEKELIICKK